MTHQEKLMKIKLGLLAKECVPKPKKYLKRVSDKKAAELKDHKEGGGDNEMDLFYAAMRKKMAGVCQCGCGKPSQKKDDTFYRNCICHIFPKRIFKSIANHELNWVERTFWEGHHSNMDNKSMDLWVNFEDWDDIKAKFHELSPLLNDEERATKFYTHLEKLVYAR